MSRSKFINIIYFVWCLDESETGIGVKLRVTGNFTRNDWLSDEADVLLSTPGTKGNSCFYFVLCNYQHEDERWFRWVHGCESSDGQSLLSCFPLYLRHLLQDCFAHDAKDSTFPPRFQINLPWLHGVTWNVNLQRKVKWIVKTISFILDFRPSLACKQIHEICPYTIICF